MTAEPDNSIEVSLAELENEPLPQSTRDRTRDRAAEDEIEIEHADDGQPSESAPAQRAPELREIPPEEGIEALRARLQGAEIARQQAEQRAQIAEQQRVQAASQTQDANVQFLDTALQGLKQNIGVLKANLAEAYAVQDFNAVADLQVEISRAAQRESQIEAGLEQLKAMPRPQAAQPQMPSPEAQVEAVASQLSPNAAAWVRAHPTYVTDPHLNAKLMSAHYAATGEGLEGDSPAYIQFVERTLGLGDTHSSSPRPGFVEERTPAVAESRPRAAPPAAPVSRANGGSNPTRVTLTREQREMARELFPDELLEDPSGRKSEQAYARNMLVLKREGRLN